MTVLTDQEIENILKLQKGFDVITDISDFKRGDSEAVKMLHNAILFLKEKGVNRIVRVVGGSKSGPVEFAENTKRAESYVVPSVYTMSA